jgi:hypothetical protein
MQRERERERCISKLLRHLGNAPTRPTSTLGTYVPLELTRKTTPSSKRPGPSPKKQRTPPVLLEVDHSGQTPTRPYVLLTSTPDPGANDTGHYRHYGRCCQVLGGNLASGSRRWGFGRRAPPSRRAREAAVAGQGSPAPTRAVGRPPAQTISRFSQGSCANQPSAERRSAGDGRVLLLVVSLV